jgi:TonB family protein
MRRRERFGKLVLLDELEAVHLGATYLAARPGPSGLDRIVTLLRFSEAVSAHPDVAARLMDQARRAARFGIRGLMPVLGIGRAGPSYYVSHQLVEGRSLRVVIDRSRQEGFPLSVENALMVASRAAAILQALHEQKDDEGALVFHGLLTPVGLVVSWEGEIQVREVGLWAGLRGSSLAEGVERRHLAPEQRDGGGGDVRCDVHALGVVLLEMLTGWSPDQDSDPLEAVSRATVTTVTGDPEPIPGPIQEILSRALAPEPSKRHQQMAEMRQAIDALLFSGDFSPTTFNLAFFMQTLFREDMEREGRALAEARGADYSEYLPSPEPEPSTPEPAPSTPEPAPSTPERAPSTPERAPSTPDLAPSASESAAESPDRVSPREGTPADGDEGAAATMRLTAPPPSEVVPESLSTAVAPRQDSSGPSSSGRRPRPGGRRGASVSQRGASGRLLASASRPPAGRRGLALAGGALLASLVGVGGGYLYFARVKPATDTRPSSRLSPEAAAALRRVRQLEKALATLEREKAELEAAMKASSTPDEAGREPPRDGRQTGPAVPRPHPEVPTPDTRAQDEARAQAEARRRAQAEKARREEQGRLLEEQIREAQRRLVMEQGNVGSTFDLSTALKGPITPLPTPEPVPPPTTRPSVLPGELVDADDPGVSDPVLVDEGPPVFYPAAAKNLGRSALVVVEALVGEDGRVLDVRILESSVVGLGFEEVAGQKVRTHRYRPARKDGVPVRVWIRVAVHFTP